MIRIFILVGFVFLFLDGLSQQSLFNVSSSDITQPKRFFFQQQFNLSRGSLQLNSTFNLGLKRNAELGFNILGFNVLTDSFKLDYNPNKATNPVYPFFTANFQKAFIINRNFKIALGTQTGFSAGWHLGSYTFLNLVTAVPKTRTKIIAGVYGSTNSFVGEEKRNSFFLRDAIGFQTGIEQELIEETLMLIVENISGKHNLGESSIGLAYYIFPHWSLSLGHQFANTNGTALRATVLELTYVPAAHVHKRLFKHGHKTE